MNGTETYSMIILPIAMIAIFYFVLIRPQRKKDKLVKEMLSQLVVGDKIITIGGIHGKITSIKDDDLVIESGSPSEKSMIKISRWAVREVVKPFEG